MFLNTVAAGLAGEKLSKIDQKKVTHFYEFSGTQNVSRFGHPLYLDSSIGDGIVLAVFGV